MTCFFGSYISPTSCLTLRPCFGLDKSHYLKPNESLWAHIEGKHAGQWFSGGYEIKAAKSEWETMKISRCVWL